jgi:hypothetical protein
MMGVWRADINEEEDEEEQDEVMELMVVEEDVGVGGYGGCG